MALYALTILLGAFLLFQVQPLIGKAILPWFGGTPAVWTTCMLFFQVALLAGYGYAHVLGTKANRRVQMAATFVILAAALFLLPIIPSDSWKPTTEANPTWRILLLLGATVGLPFFVLATTSPLLQKWFSLQHPGRSVYRLYSVSNFGSLTALVTYPVLIEPMMTSKTQAWVWSIGFVVLAALYAATVIRLHRRKRDDMPSFDPESNPNRPARNEEAPPTIFVRLLWVLLAATGSTMLLAVTNRMCLDVSVIPFLWVLPLAVYLSTFIICFDHARWYQRSVFWPAMILSSIWMCWALWQGADASILAQVSVYTVGLFLCCMTLHGELVGLKPGPQRLTEFYFLISLGGALGGVFVAVVAPLVFNSYLELNIVIGLCPLLAGLAFWRSARCRAFLPTLLHRSGFLAVVVALSAALWVALGHQAVKETKDYTEYIRNFYGVLAVKEWDVGTPDEYIELRHGRITHGTQFKDPLKQGSPTTYFGPWSGIGLTLRYFPQRDAGLKVGIAGLGAGTLSAYGRDIDEYRFYEINPDIVRLARDSGYFTYYNDCPAKKEIIMGDARLSLEREESQGFDVIVLDAFTGDAIPVHLLTVEAFEIYLRHLKPKGVIAADISNRYVDLYPVLSALADYFDMDIVHIDSEGDDDEGVYSSTWVLLSKNEEFMSLPEIYYAGTDPEDLRPHQQLWTDTYSNLFTILTF